MSFEVERGEAVGIIGSNGAGKSTLLKILSRITEPTTGYAEMRGSMGALLETGVGFHSELPGRENIYLNGAILGMAKSEVDHKFDEIVAFSGVEKFIVPTPLLKPGLYHISVYADIPYVKIADGHEGVLSFDVSKSGYSLNPGHRGIVAPVLEWRTEALPVPGSDRGCVQEYAAELEQPQR